MLKTIILSATIVFAFCACTNKGNHIFEKNVEKVHYKVKPKLSHSFYN